MEDTIIVESLDNSHLYIDTDPAIANEMSDFFTFMAPNYWFMPKYKNGLWDGKIRLFKKRGGTLPIGLYGILCQFASERDYKVIDRRTPSPLEKPTEGQINHFMRNLNPHSKGHKIEHYDYQLEAIRLAIQNERATILSSTSSGKSLIIYSLIRWYQQRVRGKILVIVPTTNPKPIN